MKREKTVICVKDIRALIKISVFLNRRIYLEGSRLTRYS
jgi:hypothetical protein